MQGVPRQAIHELAKNRLARGRMSLENVFEFETRTTTGTHEHVALKYPH
jgi:hypothetical protein